MSIEPVDQGLVSPRGVGDVHIHVMDSVQFQYLFWPCLHIVWSYPVKLFTVLIYYSILQLSSITKVIPRAYRAALGDSQCRYTGLEPKLCLHAQSKFMVIYEHIHGHMSIFMAI